MVKTKRKIIMEFKISRASYYYDEEKPCDEAYKNNEDSSWVVCIENIVQLIDFTKKYGRCIVTESSIKIYDDYIE